MARADISHRMQVETRGADFRTRSIHLSESESPLARTWIYQSPIWRVEYIFDDRNIRDIRNRVAITAEARARKEFACSMRN